MPLSRHRSTLLLLSCLHMWKPLRKGWPWVHYRHCHRLWANSSPPDLLLNQREWESSICTCMYMHLCTFSTGPWVKPFRMSSAWGNADEKRICSIFTAGVYYYYYYYAIHLSTPTCEIRAVLFLTFHPRRKILPYAPYVLPFALLLMRLLKERKLPYVFSRRNVKISVAFCYCCCCCCCCCYYCCYYYWLWWQTWECLLLSYCSCLCRFICALVCSHLNPTA